MRRKLSEQQAIQVRLRAERGESLSQMAREYGVGVDMIRDIRDWKTYRDCFPYSWEN